ncbi:MULTISPECIES: hypothetical protein [unclassified Mycolicibacterium]|uniref:Rv1733c family protein n=1 Tax=unclassified Mycolicibacterium TaxID=2636767 RepID=UPI0012DE9D63|nr:MULTISPECIES: hypothetical protein [unclassified Mycolicibacterium]MUL81110.1 hypothetical protein [Mycolicibacterium sp. CBMA 329]MUL86876.1 hypothetical protein [Mycolicibacterium sp. CBMA 331]MUL98839.1 hypothetical protein [Mycolicibacterium sp. CBMA 334]MUM28901.1 hypothetical protein [Mycolicibacterium sp. CBMA 295]MUM37173.1 hypothetical protein [Mycolicibacterium sp. CBMA 247]
MRVSRRRWWVLRALSRNPLVRGIDRLEAWAMVLALVFAALVIPHAINVGQNIYGETLRTAEIQAQTRTQVDATVVTDTNPKKPNAPDATAVVTLTWTANGTPHTGVVRPGRSIKVGDTIPIWVDRAGRRVPPPMSPDSAGTYAAATGAFVWLGAVMLCGLVLAALRALLDRLRFHTWSAELRVLLDRGDGRTKWHH